MDGVGLRKDRQMETKRQGGTQRSPDPGSVIILSLPLRPVGEKRHFDPVWVQCNDAIALHLQTFRDWTLLGWAHESIWRKNMS